MTVVKKLLPDHVASVSILVYNTLGEGGSATYHNPKVAKTLVNSLGRYKKKSGKVRSRDPNVGSG